MTEASTVALCTTATDAGTLTLAAASTGIPAALDLAFAWNGDPTCQVFVDFLTPQGTDVSSNAMTIVNASVAPPTQAPTEQEGTNLAESGSRDVTQALTVGGALLLAGAAAIAAASARRRVSAGETHPAISPSREGASSSS